MGELTRAFDWSKTPVGPIHQWPQSLLTAVQLMLSSRYPMFVWWGPDLINFYNDGYIPVLGKRHPKALGRSAPEIWSDIWDIVGPQAQDVLENARANWNEELLLVMERNEFLEETYFTYSYSPIRDDDGEVRGVFCACTEDTQRVISQRRLQTIGALAANAAAAKTAGGVCRAAAETVSGNPHDVPFALLYLLDESGRQAELYSSSGIEADTTLSPTCIKLGAEDNPWPVERALAAEGGATEVARLSEKFDAVPGGAWPEPAERALIMPLARPGQDRPTGVLIAGISPRRPFDEGYQDFISLMAGQIATGIGNARAYEEERRRAEALAELDRAKTLFFSNVSHEFRTPLTLMLGPAEDALADVDEALNERQRERLELIQHNALRLQKLVNALLDFSRIEAGRFQACFEPLDLSALTADLVSNFRSACEKAGLDLVVDCDPLPEPVFVDRDMWEKIVLNLVSNAFKFTLEGSITVSLDSVGEAARLQVKDTGVGIPEDQVPKLFERFHRVERRKGRSHEGSGIGLALVRELVERHGGAVDVESEPERGSTFTITLPFGKSHLPSKQVGSTRTLESTATGAAPFVEEALRWVPETAREATPAESPAVSKPDLPNPEDRPRILVVDDNADMLRYIVRLLEPRFATLAVMDGEKAFDALMSEPFDLVLADIMMPGMDGFELLQAIRDDSELQRLPVLLLSARAGEEARIEGMEAGADDYLVKPFGARELLARVDSHLKMSRLRRESRAALRESERKFQLIADSIPQLAWMAQPDGYIFWYNRRWYEYTGTTPAEMEGWGWQSVHDPDTLPDVLRQWRASIESGKPLDMVFPLRGADGEYRQFLTRVNPLHDDDGEILYWFGTNTDISEQRAIQEELRVTAEKLSDAHRRKDEFLATLAHELRNPLAPIRTGLELIRMLDDDPAQVERTIETMERQTEQLITLVNDLMHVSRITRGKLKLRKERVDLAEIVDSAVEASRPLIDAMGHELTIEVPDDPIRIEADPHRIAQVISNLLNNAVKYTREGGHIELTVKRRDGAAEIRVEDDGIGIAPAELERIFEMFAQIDDAGDRVKAGLGIGLTLVRSLVEMHGGEIRAYSEGEGQGSQFIVRLPLVAEDTETVETQVSPQEAEGNQEGLRVLIADDNEAVCETLKTLMSAYGNEVRIAMDGRQAIEIAEQYRPDLIIMDLGMPRLNGYEAARQLRASPWGAEIFMVALTGWGQEEDREKSRDAGFDDHMVKPPEPAALRHLLQTVEQRLTARGDARGRDRQ